MRTIRWLTEAWGELDAITDYVLEMHGKQIANRVRKNIIARIELLPSMPKLGTLDSSLHYQGKPVRILHSWHTRIIYAVRETEIVVILLWDNRVMAAY